MLAGLARKSARPISITTPVTASIVVPLFGDRNDQVALATLAELFPRHKIVGIENSREILLGGGNVACITMPQYAGTACNKQGV